MQYYSQDEILRAGLSAVTVSILNRFVSFSILPFFRESQSRACLFMRPKARPAACFFLVYSNDRGQLAILIIPSFPLYQIQEEKQDT